MFEIFAKHAGIAGLGLGLLLVLFRAVIGKNSSISQSNSYKLLTLITVLVWVTAMTSIVIWAYLATHPSPVDAHSARSQSNDQRRYLASYLKVTPKKFETSYREKNYNSGTIETVKVFINYPQIAGHPDTRVERKINELVKKTAGVYSNHEAQSFDHNVSYEIISFEYDILSISFEDNGIYLGAATSNTMSKTLNVNLMNGEPFELKDLFRAGYQQKLLKLFDGKIDCELLSPPTIGDNQNFFIRAGKLIVVYERREICPGVVGPVEVEIDLDSVKAFVNPNGPISYVL